MELLTRTRVAQTLYAALFVLVVPLALIAWAHGARHAVHVPPLHSPLWGSALATCGVGIVVLAMFALWRHGGGLPMNAFPPPRFVQTSLYALVPHPIYGGFVLACAGIAICTGSAAGLWLVTPAVALACAALVLGYELPDLRRRFGPRTASPWLPCDSLGPPSLLERLRVYFVVLLPWLALFELMGALGAGPGAVSTYLPFEHRLPILQATELIYASTYLVVLATPLILTSAHALRQFARRGLTAIALIFPLYLFLPFNVPPRPFTPTTALGQLLLLERTPASGVAAFPSFHVVWACIAASALGSGKRWKQWLWGTWAVLVAVSCITTGMHSIADVLAGALAYLAVARIGSLWSFLLRAAQRIANSWREWRLGPLRIINHGAFAAAGILVGMSVIDTLLGPHREVLTASIFLCSSAGAALWAQWVEGSPSLLRPMGFYGSMIGAILGSLPALALGINLWSVFAVVALAAPWIQGIGRLRCLVQGCCHGRPAAHEHGIRYFHPRSRVCRLAGLAGIPIHATPLYSLLWNCLTGCALLRLLLIHAPATLLFGIYLLLSGCGRFVEEAYRGEPQTLHLYGLHLYQWIALATVAAGAVITTIPSPPLPPIEPLRATSLLLGAACAAVAWFVTGIDFPESSRRFARLT